MKDFGAFSEFMLAEENTDIDRKVRTHLYNLEVAEQSAQQLLAQYPEITLHEDEGYTFVHLKRFRSEDEQDPLYDDHLASDSIDLLEKVNTYIEFIEQNPIAASKSNPKNSTPSL
jgi:hypothetical protein